MTDVLGRLSSALADRYRIQRELGGGGMATVYLAHDLKHHRGVAIEEDASMNDSRVAVKLVPATGIRRATW